MTKYMPFESHNLWDTWHIIIIYFTTKYKRIKLKGGNINCTWSGEILDDVVRRGCHNVFWWNPFEREVSNFVSIRSNQINIEVTYNEYFPRHSFTKMHRARQLDRDDLFPHNRALVTIHEYLQTPSNVQDIQLMGSRTICEQWHKSCVTIVHSQDVARTIWKLSSVMPSCPCKDLIHEKGIVVGRKKNERA